MRQWTVIGLIIAFVLYGENSLLEPLMVYWILEPNEHISMKLYLKFINFIQEVAYGNVIYENGGHLVPAAIC